MKKVICLFVVLMLCLSFACTAFASDAEGDFVSSPSVTEPVDCEHHEYEVIGQKDPTCTTEGYTGDHVCKDCNKVIKEGTVIPKIPHNYVDGICSVCGDDVNIPQTGDNSMVGMWAVIMVIAVTVLTAITVVYRKKFANR